jgi:hypothetical protein
MERNAVEKDWNMKDRINCPVCGTDSVLQEFEDDMYIDRIRKVVKYKMINYKCESCDECFTTTESDTIVVNSINKGIRCEKRKSKIKKYVP